MSSVNRSEGSNPSNQLRVSNGGSVNSGEARTLKRLAKAGKNDSVKSTYSLSVFLDPDASKDMMRYEELWYPMDDPSSSDNQGQDGTNQGPRTATLSTAAGSRGSEDRLMLTQEQREEQWTSVSNQTADYRQNEELMRNGGRSTTSSTGALRSAHRESRSGTESGTDMETHFNRNTVVLGVQSGDGGRRGGGGGSGGAEEYGGGRGGAGEYGGGRGGAEEYRGRGGAEQYGGRGGAAEQYGGGRGGVGRGGGQGGERTAVGAGTGTIEESEHGVRRWSTKGNLPRASEGHDSDEDDEYGEDVAEQEEISQVRSQIGDLSRAPPPGRGVGASSDSADDEDVVDYSTRIEERSDFRHVHNASGTAAGENGDGYYSDTRVRQGTAQILKTSDSSTEEEEEEEEDADGYQIATQGRKSFGEQIRGASSGSNLAGDEDVAAKYSSTMQQRTSFGQSRSRAEPTSFTTDDGRSSNAVSRDGSMARMAQGRNASDDEELTLTEGSDEGETGRSHNREPIHARPKLSRAMQVDGGYRGIDSQVYQNGVSQVTSAPRNSSSFHSDGELVRDYQGRGNASGFGREGIRRATTQSEDEIGRGRIPGSLTYRGAGGGGGGRGGGEGGPNVRRPSLEVSSEDDTNSLNNHPDGTLNRRNDPNTSAYNNRRRTEEGSSEGEQEGSRHNGRQATPLIRVTTPSSSSYSGPGRGSQQVTSDEDVARVNARSNPPTQAVPTSRGRDSASNGFRNAPTESRSLTSEEEERVNGSGHHRNRPGGVSNSPRPRDAGQYQPHPAERKKLVTADSLSSTEYSSPREPYSSNNYIPRAANTRGRGGTDTDSVSASDDSRTLNHRANGNAPTRRVYRDKGYSTHAISPDVQPRSGTSRNDRYSGSSPSNLTQPPQHRRPSANQTTSYSDDESDVDDYTDTPRSQQQFVLDFPSEPEDLEGTGRNSTRKTTVRKTTTTPMTGVVRVTPQPPSGEVVRETRTKVVKTTPVIGVVSIADDEPRQTFAVAPPQRSRTPVVGLISVSRSPSPVRSKTPVVGLISVPPPQSHSVAASVRTTQPVTGLISVSNGNQMLRRSTTPSAQLMPDVNNNTYAYPGKFRTDLTNTVIETVPVPISETQSEIVGIDPELRRARKTGSNQYRITMNLRPVVGDSSELGYEVYDTAFGRATPVSMVNGTRGDWRYSEGSERSYYRPPSAPVGTLRSRQSSVIVPNNQLGFVTRRSGNEGSSISKLNSASYSPSSHGRIVSPVGRQVYNIPSRQGPPQYLRNTLLQVPPIHQTVTSRPRRLSNDAVLPGHNQVYLDGGRCRQNRLSSAMSSVFLSPTVERRCNLNAAANGLCGSFRDDTYYRGGRFN